ncbi:MAG: methyltransferase domain-containing protein [Anaerolineae bacterium]|nr:methyltransferase domain-containing protein [Anaerolineae bacterium]
MTPGRRAPTEREAATSAVQALYRSNPSYEWQRLERHRTEFAVTWRALAEHLPPAPAQVLDCGGGPGRYAIALAQQGYSVTLFDLSPELLGMAREKAAETGVTLAGYKEGTAIDLSCFDDAAFDAVLLMGPLYHLLDAGDRQQALAEARRVVRPNGPVFAAFIARYAGHIDAAASYPEEAISQWDAFDRIETTGVQPPREDGEVGFVAYFAHPAEVAPLCRRAGLEVTAVLGVEGVCSLREEKVNALHGKAWEHWVDVNYRIAHDPSIHGGVEHLLVVCRKPRWRTVLRRVAQALDAAGIDYRVVGSAALALHGVDVAVHDLDLEMSRASADLFQTRFAERTVVPVAWRESDEIRSYFGRFEIDDVAVEVMADFERRRRGRWVPSLSTTRDTRDVDGVPVTVLTLEEEVLAQLRRGRLDKVARALPICDANGLLTQLAAAQDLGWL